MPGWVPYLFLGIFLLLFGIFSVTNLKVDWGKEIEGFSALIAGIICIIAAVKGMPPARP